ncbi:unnamed protein product [Caretta caretta]
MREASNKIKWIAEARSLEGGRLCCEGTLERKGETPRIYKNQRLRFSGFLALSFSTCGARLQIGKPAIPSYCIFQPSFCAVFPLWLLLLWLRNKASLDKTRPFLTGVENDCPTVVDEAEQVQHLP